MKRIVLTVASSSLLAFAMPGIAAAANHSAHHARHTSAHARHVHAKHASVITLGTLAPTPAPAVVTPPPPPPPPTPKASTPPATPTPCTPEQVGTVVSFENEVLTIELCDKSTYTGEVTEGTEIKCRSEAKSEEGKVHNDEDSNLTQGEGSEEEDDCSTTLVKGAKIYGAELALTSFGPIWEKIGLLS
jgi:type IV secretory pathway VirB10-like protein